MTRINLDSQQQLSLNNTLQVAFDRCAAALQLLLGGEINIEVVPAALHPPGICVRLALSGALEGGIALDLPETMALEIVKSLTTERELALLDETARSALMELGNILASVFVGYFDQTRGLRTLPSPPQLSFAPLPLPGGPWIVAAELGWSKSPGRAEIFVGLERSALDILLA